MDIIKTSDGTALKIDLIGRLDTTTAPKLESELKTAISGVNDLVFDFSKLDYISSAGLRVLLSAQKVMNRQGDMKITGCNETIMEIFEVTGFVDILNIENLSSQAQRTSLRQSFVAACVKNP